MQCAQYLLGIQKKTQPRKKDKKNFLVCLRELKEKTITTKILEESFLHHYVLFACCACRERLWLGEKGLCWAPRQRMKLIGSVFLYIWSFLYHSCSIWEL